MELLVQRFYEKYAQTNLRLVRNAINTIDWNNRLVGIKGSRGVGKTTLLLQHIKQNFKPNSKVLFVTLDNIYFSTNHLYDLANEFYKKGGKLLALDEVHRYPTWAQEIKNIYDDFPDLNIVFTGSSLLQLSRAKADLSRRAVMYTLPGLSFREYLQFQGLAYFPTIRVDELLSNHVELAMEVAKKVKPLEHFGSYLSHGYYPFYVENLNVFHQKLQETIQVVLEIDIPQFETVKTSNIIYLKRLLQIISESVPFRPNINSISQRTGISINTLKQYVHYLSEANLITLLHADADGISSLSKPEKIYLQNTNLMHSLAGASVNTGQVRETFLVSQLQGNAKIEASRFADFVVDGKYTLEVGGKKKGKKQIDGLANSYVVKDGIEIGNDNTVPLYLFGFLH